MSILSAQPGRVLLVLLILFPPAAAARQGGEVEPADLLTRGTMSQAVADLNQRLEQHPRDDNARFALAIAQTLRAVESLAGSLHRYGLRTDTWAREMPFFRLPVPDNPNPEPIGYEQSRQIVQAWLDDMQAVRSTLSEIHDPASVKLRLPVGMMHLDLDGDGRATEGEALWQLFAAVNPGGNVSAMQAREFIVGLDGGDVHWLHGYCHLLSALPEMVLAYDHADLFNATAHLFYREVTTPHAFLNEGIKVADFGMGVDVVDAIAFVHLLNLPLREPERMKVALEHLQSMIDHSRRSWALIMMETDDDNEWIPNAKQTTVLPNMGVTGEMISGWHAFLDEGEAVLAGRKLIPFWRSEDGRGVNLQRVFTEPTRFDLVLWIQGTAATPYLERGQLTDPQTWVRFQRIFMGQFFTFAIWFN
jgi:hypothetical protein